MTSLPRLSLFLVPTAGEFFEGGACLVSILFATVVAPACFRLTPPDTAGRLFHELSRGMLGTATAFAAIAGLFRYRSYQYGRSEFYPFLFDLGAAVLLVAALTTLRSFGRARDAALRETPAGGTPNGPEILRAHALLRGLRALALLAALLAFAAAPLVRIIL